LCDFAISFEFHLLAQKLQFGVIIYSVIGELRYWGRMFLARLTPHRHENKYTLVVNSLCTVQ